MGRINYLPIKDLELLTTFTCATLLIILFIGGTLGINELKKKELLNKNP